MSSKTVLEVGCAVIAGSPRDPETRGKILIAQRKPGDSLGGFWEFPGGRVEDGENLEDCLVREVWEELGVGIRPRRFLGLVNHSYPTQEVRLHFYLCDWRQGRPVRHDCLHFRWVLPDELHRYTFPRADRDMIQQLIRNRASYFSA